MGVGSSADLIGTHDSIALRVPNSTLTVALLKETGPLAITSANPSGACDCTHHNKVSQGQRNKEEGFKYEPKLHTSQVYICLYQLLTPLPPSIGLTISSH